MWDVHSVSLSGATIISVSVEALTFKPRGKNHTRKKRFHTERHHRCDALAGARLQSLRCFHGECSTEQTTQLSITQWRPLCLSCETPWAQPQ